jgi:hypothetical protein
VPRQGSIVYLVVSKLQFAKAPLRLLATNIRETFSADVDRLAAVTNVADR